MKETGTDKPQILTQTWRERHVIDGDDWLQVAADRNRSPEDRTVAVAIAQAHYQAANVRAKFVAKASGADEEVVDMSNRR
jgi:hypothetical protein